jgi:transcriptional regulator with XRE-family HTH domain
VLGARLRGARLRAGLTLRELGLLLRPTTHPSTVSNWERGKRVPRQTTMAQLADLFEWGTRDVGSPAAGGLVATVDAPRMPCDSHSSPQIRRISGGDLASRPTSPLARFEELLDNLRRAYEEAFLDGRAVGRGEAQKELQLLRKQLASERDRVQSQRDQLVQLQRSADMRRLSHDPGRP